MNKKITFTVGRKKSGFMLIDLFIGMTLIAFTVLSISLIMRQLSQHSLRFRMNSKVEASYHSVSESLRGFASTDFAKMFDDQSGVSDPYPHPYDKLIHCRALVGPINVNNRTRSVDLIFTWGKESREYKFLLSQTQDKLVGATITVKAVLKGSPTVGIGGIHMTCPGNDQTTVFCITHEDGVCTLTGAKATNDILTITADGTPVLYYTDATSPPGFLLTKDVTVSQNIPLDLTGQPFQFLPPGQIVGKITDISDANNLQPSSATYVGIYSKPNSCVIPTWGVNAQMTQTDSRGQYAFAVIPGDYTVIHFGSKKYAATEYGWLPMHPKDPGYTDWTRVHPTMHPDIVDIDINTMQRGTIKGKLRMMGNSGTGEFFDVGPLSGHVVLQTQSLITHIFTCQSFAGDAWTVDFLPLGISDSVNPWYGEFPFDGTDHYTLPNWGPSILCREPKNPTPADDTAFRNEYSRNDLTTLSEVDPPLVPIYVLNPFPLSSAILVATALPGSGVLPASRGSPVGLNVYPGLVDNIQDLNILTLDALADVKGKITQKQSDGSIVPFGMTGSVTMPDGFSSTAVNLGGVVMNAGRYWVDPAFQVATYGSNNQFDMSQLDEFHSLGYRPLPPNVRGQSTTLLFSTPLTLDPNKVPKPFNTPVRSEGTTDPTNRMNRIGFMVPPPNMDVIVNITDATNNPNSAVPTLPTIIGTLNNGALTVTPSIGQWTGWMKSMTVSLAPGQTVNQNFQFEPGEGASHSYHKYKVSLENAGSNGLRSKGWFFYPWSNNNRSDFWTFDNGFNNPPDVNIQLAINQVQNLPLLYGQVLGEGNVPIENARIVICTRLQTLENGCGGSADLRISKLDAYVDSAHTSYQYKFTDVEFVQILGEWNLSIYAQADGYQTTKLFYPPIDNGQPHRCDIHLQKNGDGTDANF